MPTPSIPYGSICKFLQTTPPVGWVKQTTYTDYALRVVNGTIGTGGSRTFSAVFTNQAPTTSGTMGVVTGVSVSPANAGAVTHAHSGPAMSITSPGGNYIYDPGSALVPTLTAFGASGASPPTTTSAGSGGAHTHPITIPPTYNSPSVITASTNADFSIKYVDMIMATRNIV